MFIHSLIHLTTSSRLFSPFVNQTKLTLKCLNISTHLLKKSHFKNCSTQKNLKQFSIIKKTMLGLGTLIVSGFVYFKMNSHTKAIVAQKNQEQATLKSKELYHYLETFPLEQLKVLFARKGHEFDARREYLFLDFWDSIDKDDTILQDALKDPLLADKLPLETRKFLLDFCATSLRAQVLGLNPIHIFIECKMFQQEKGKELLQQLIQENPHYLRQRDKVDGLNMNPLEMAIRRSYNKKLMNNLLNEYEERFGFTINEKNRLLSHAQWLSKSGICNTALIGKEMWKQIEQMPIKNESTSIKI